MACARRALRKERGTALRYDGVCAVVDLFEPEPQRVQHMCEHLFYLAAGRGCFGGFFTFYCGGFVYKGDLEVVAYLVQHFRQRAGTGAYGLCVSKRAALGRQHGGPKHHNR